MTALATLRDVGFEEWLGKINTACGRFCAKTLGPGFSGAMQEFRAHALRLSVVDVAQARLYRTPREIARSDGAHFFTVIQLRGSALMEQGDRQTMLSPGDMTLIDASQPSSFTFQRDSRQISLLLPRGCLPLPPPCAQRLGAELSAVRLSRQLVLSSMQDPQLAAAESEAVLNALAALLRPALALEQARPEGQQSVFDKALALIDRHIQSAQLRLSGWRPSWGCRYAACIGCSPVRGWWWRSTSGTAGWICARRRCAAPPGKKSWPALASTGASPITAISRPLSSSVSACRRASTVGSISKSGRGPGPRRFTQ